MRTMFLVMMLAYLGANIYIYIKFLQQISGVALWGKITLSILFWVIVLALFLSFMLRHSQVPSALLGAIYVVGSSWMVFTLYMTLLLLLFDLLKFAGIGVNHSTLWAFAATAMLLIVGYIVHLNPKTIHIDIKSEKMLGSRLRIVTLSDVHLGYGTGVRMLERYVEMINRHKPDIVVIAGDLIDNSTLPVREKGMDKILRQIDAPKGVYMAPGNHEYISGIEECAELCKMSNITLLRDSTAVIDNKLFIIGRDDRSNHRRKELSELLSGCDSSQLSIVIDHQPYELSQSDSLGVDVQISGHTHHGQVWPLSLVTDHLYEQSHGYREWSHSHIFVSSGLSLWGPPFRIGTRGDMAVFDFAQ